MIKTILAIIPLAWMLFGLSKLKLPLHKVSVSAFLLTVIIAIAFFSMQLDYLVQASLEGFMLAVFPIIWIILSALFVYRVTVASGGMEQMKKMLSSVSPDRRIQGLILAFAFGGFLESVAGFGTAVAIPAGILVSMGFRPFMATIICLMANTVPVAFGVLGVPIITLSQVTSLSIDKLSYYTSLQLIPFAVVLPVILVAAITGSWRDVKGTISVSLLSGMMFALGQTLASVFIGPELAAMTGSLLSMVFLVIWIRIFPVKKPWKFKEERASQAVIYDALGLKEILTAWSPYLLLLIIILSTRFLAFFDFLNRYPFSFGYQFYHGAGGKQMQFPIAASGGTLLFISAVFGGLIQGISAGKIFLAFIQTLKQVWRSAVTVLFIVALAKIMGYSGMIIAISAIFTSAGMFFPAISPALGALGTFLTGSDTSSNVLFGNLQKQTAINLHLNTEWITAANGSGATAGKMISPQSISIVISSVGLSGEDWNILRKMLIYCLGYVAAMGIFVFSVQKLFF